MKLPVNPAHPRSNPLAAAGHLALWVGLYAASWTCIALWMFEVTVSRAAVGVAFCATIAVYLLDRIKLRNSAVDPADVEAHPARLTFLTHHALFVRALMILFMVAAGVIGWTLTPWLLLILIAASVGVWLYGSMPRRPRVKDRLIIKNAAVAVSMTALFTALAIYADEPNAGSFWPEAWPPTFWSVSLFGALHIFADAMLCDLDDAPSDAAYGTDTIVNRVGERRTWVIAILLSFGGSAILVVEGMTRSERVSDPTTLWTLAIGLVIAKLLLGGVRGCIAPRGRWVRDAIDLHVPAVVGLALVVRSMS